MMASMTVAESEIVPGQHVLSYLTPEDGDVPFTWDPGNDEDVRTARRIFDDLHRNGYLAYKVTPGKRGAEPAREQIRRFDPQAGQIVMVPPLRGG
jgi:hypothetical protein